MKNPSDNRKRAQIAELLRFAIVGTTAVAIQYIVYLVLIHVLNPTLSNTTGYAVSFVFNYIASTHFTFRVKSTTKRGAGFALAHLINWLLQTLLLNAFISFGMSKQIAMITMFTIAVPINFLLVRHFLKQR